MGAAPQRRGALPRVSPLRKARLRRLSPRRGPREVLGPSADWVEAGEPHAMSAPAIWSSGTRLFSVVVGRLASAPGVQIADRLWGYPRFPALGDRNEPAACLPCAAWRRSTRRFTKRERKSASSWHWHPVLGRRRKARRHLEPQPRLRPDTVWRSS